MIATALTDNNRKTAITGVIMMTALSILQKKNIKGITSIKQEKYSVVYQNTIFKEIFKNK